MVLDPSDKFRPERDEKEFRNYTLDNAYHDRVRRTYYEMHTNMTVDFVKQQVRGMQIYNDYFYIALSRQ